NGMVFKRIIPPFSLPAYVTLVFQYVMSLKLACKTLTLREKIQASVWTSEAESMLTNLLSFSFSSLLCRHFLSSVYVRCQAGRELTNTMYFNVRPFYADIGKMTNLTTLLLLGLRTKSIHTIIIRKLPDETSIMFSNRRIDVILRDADVVVYVEPFEYVIGCTVFSYIPSIDSV
ncbi:hypothetical protein L9F63_007092, partial [Diploptera punctata]